MLLTKQQISRRQQLVFPQKDRFVKVRKSMGAIKQVLGERKIAAIAHHREKKMLEQLKQKGAMGDSDNNMKGDEENDGDDDSSAANSNKNEGENEKV
jgi:hypothetical protein